MLLLERFLKPGSVYSFSLVALWWMTETLWRLLGLNMLNGKTTPAVLGHICETDPNHFCILLDKYHFATTLLKVTHFWQAHDKARNWVARLDRRFLSELPLSDFQTYFSSLAETGSQPCLWDNVRCGMGFLPKRWIPHGLPRLPTPPFSRPNGTTLILALRSVSKKLVKSDRAGQDSFPFGPFLFFGEYPRFVVLKRHQKEDRSHFGCRTLKREARTLKSCIERGHTSPATPIPALGRTPLVLTASLSKSETGLAYLFFLALGGLTLISGPVLEPSVQSFLEVDAAQFLGASCTTEFVSPLASMEPSPVPPCPNCDFMLFGVPFHAYGDMPMTLCFKGHSACSAGTTRFSYEASSGSERKVSKAFEEAMGGVLFIDEAYSIVQGDRDSFGKEAVDTIIKLMEVSGVHLPSHQ